MTIAPAVLKLGFKPAHQLQRGPRKRLMIGSDGPADTGKTEFILSIPGPGVVICVDRGYEAMLDNPNPPAERRMDEYAFMVIDIPLESQAGSDFAEYWRKFYSKFKEVLGVSDIHVIGIDGDSDTWELQRLAQWGRLSKVPPLEYTKVNAARRVMYARAFDSGKTIVATNKIKKEYEDVIDPATGQVKVSEAGNNIREWQGSYKRQGFDDQDYLFQIQLRHMRRDNAKTGAKEFGIHIQKCKAQPDLIGYELWGDECNYRGLVSTVYPHIDLGEWGF